MPHIKRGVKKQMIKPLRRAPVGLPTEIGLPALAKLLGIGITEAQQLVDRGIIVRGNPGHYILMHSVASYCAHLRERIRTLL
jgi:hypothetical protein